VRAAGLEPRRPGPRRRAAGEARPAVEQRGPDRPVGADGRSATRDRRAADDGRSATRDRRAADDGSSGTDALAVALKRARVAEARARDRVRVARRDARSEALDRFEALIADADARVRAADDQAAAAARDAADARRAAATAERRARELSALVGDGQRRLTPGELAALRADGASGPAVLAGALRRLAKARAAGDRGGLRSALGEVASAAVRWHDRL